MSGLKTRASSLTQRQAGWVPAVGQTVFVPRLGRNFKVAAANAATGQLQLQAGKLKLKATVEEVRRE